MKITKYWINKWSPCVEAVEWLNERDTKDVFELIKLLKKSSIKDKYEWLTWAIPRLLKTKRARVRLAVYSATLVLPNFEKAFPNDKRPRGTIALVKKWLKNPSSVSREELQGAASAAWGAWSAAWGAWSAGGAARSAESAARSAERSAERKMQIKIINYGIKLLKEQPE